MTPSWRRTDRICTHWELSCISAWQDGLPFIGEYVGDVLAMQMMQEPPQLGLQSATVKADGGVRSSLAGKRPTMRPSMEEVIRELQRLLDLLTKSQTQVSGPIPLRHSRPTLHSRCPQMRFAGLLRPSPPGSGSTSRASILQCRGDRITTDRAALCPAPATPRCKQRSKASSCGVSSTICPNSQTGHSRRSERKELVHQRADSLRSGRFVGGTRCSRPDAITHAALGDAFDRPAGTAEFSAILIPGMLALTLAVSLSLYATIRRDHVRNSQQQLQPMDAGASYDGTDGCEPAGRHGYAHA